LKGALLIFAVHFIIDVIRCRVEIKLFGPNLIYVKRSEFMDWIKGKSKNPEKMNMRNLWPWLMINIFDQGLHLGGLYVIAQIV